MQIGGRGLRDPTPAPMVQYVDVCPPHLFWNLRNLSARFVPYGILVSLVILMFVCLAFCVLDQKERGLREMHCTSCRHHPRLLVLGWPGRIMLHYPMSIM